MILSGEVSLDESAADSRSVARRQHHRIAGHALGTAAGQVGRTCCAAALALRIDRDELFDLLGERPELLRQLFEGMFRVGSRGRRAAATVTV